ncbi:flagellar biosynthesis chaperone [Ruminiclostridium hungatei]|uniref:Flagellar FliJ protein n=1 Tax=Ruminiclostridium hungatei TaxID=48256 RepID=A0A1V4SL19_RUMHU|nr:flagellar export protein FliJ [Ruminiclostridium hungatei]OPX44589.1 flagellar biosynthesis chaperone [Ruminiclostridium hungatei]
MQKFGFRLESVLKLRTQLEDNAKNNLAQAARELENQKNCLVELEETREASRRALTSAVDGGVPVYQVRNFNSFFGLMKNKIVRQKENVNNAQNDVDINREALVKAMQDRKIIEKLKEKKHEDFLKEQNREEQLLIDELNSYKFKQGV